MHAALPLLALSAALAAAAAVSGTGPDPATHAPEGSGASAPAAPPAPTEARLLPRWLYSTRRDHRFPRRGPYVNAVHAIEPLARDLNAIAVGHAMAYEDLVTGRADTLETATYARIRRVLARPPRFMPDERALSPTFTRRYGVLQQVFDWAHVLHAQTVDVLASTRLSQPEKERELERLWRFYHDSVPYALTPLPLNMAYLDSHPAAGAFRRRFPRVNGLFWGYHWLQGAMYDTLYRASLEDQRAAYGVIGERYRTVELLRTDRPFMPMFAELSPEFAARFPHLANTFDNLHMLHDMVNDILVAPGLSEAQRAEQVRLAIWRVSADAHRGEVPLAPDAPAPADPLHDHRHFAGMPGMGLMPGMTPELMWMPGMGWMSMAECHHCSMPLWRGENSWRNPTVMADGWSMRVRCALCARDMALETRGAAVLRIPTEDPHRVAVILSDEQGHLRTTTPGLVFLEQEGSHVGCDDWSRAFTSHAAFARHLRDRPELQGARALPFSEWAERQGERPDTYVRRQGPTENPYQSQEPGNDR